MKSLESKFKVVFSASYMELYNKFEHLVIRVRKEKNIVSVEESKALFN